MALRTVIVACVLAASFGCSGSIGDGDGSGTGDAGGSDDDATPSGETDPGGGGGDSGGPGATDSGKVATDTGSKPPADSGTSTPDTATPPPVDTGTPPPDDTGSPPPTDATSSDPFAAARDVCLQTINEDRATLGLPPYAGWTSANSCVDDEARRDSISGTAHSAFGSCGESAQNECPGYPGTPDTELKTCLGQMWAEGPGSDFHAHGHYINMTSTSYTAVSCGFFVTSSGSWWGAQDFH